MDTYTACMHWWRRSEFTRARSPLGTALRQRGQRRNHRLSSVESCKCGRGLGARKRARSASLKFRLSNELSQKACSPSKGTRPRRARARGPPAATILKPVGDSLSSDAITETHEVTCMRNVRSSVTTLTAARFEECSRASAFVCHTLVEHAAHARCVCDWLQVETKVSSIPSSDRSHSPRLVSWVRGAQHETTRTTDTPR